MVYFDCSPTFEHYFPNLIALEQVKLIETKPRIIAGVDLEYGLSCLVAEWVLIGVYFVL
jgi:hypothetical protein